jgi:DNA-binding winged helix-turn-helix (wHTH) protein/predicted ATPase
MQYLFGDYALDTRHCELRRTGTLIKLRPKVFDVLLYLIVHRDRVIAQQELLEHLWPDQFVGDATLKSCIKEARRAVGDTGQAQRCIQTLHSRGYRFVDAVEEREHLTVDVTAPLAWSPPSAGRSVVLPVGREAELTCLHAWLASALRGVRQVVFVTGEAGLGKTTLVEAFVAQLGAFGPLWLWHGQCVEHYGAGEPYMPVLEALRRACRGPGGQEVVALLRQQAPTWLMQMPGLVRATDLEMLRRRMIGVTRERMLRELTEALDLLTAQQPLIIVLEDLHWSDPSTMDLIAVLARRQEPARLLLLGTYRSPEVRRRAHPVHTVTQELQLHGHSVELPLTLLSEDAVAVYLAGRFPGLLRVDQLARLVHQRTEGNPLFMVLLVESWRTQGLLLEQDGAWTLSAEIEALHDQVPDSLRQYIEQHLEQLSEADQAFLEAASVAGSTFAVAAVAAGVAQAPETLEARYTALARQGWFIRASGTETWPDGTVTACYQFIHALYHEIVYARVSAGHLVRLHQQIGARKEAGYGAQARQIATELAVHFSRGRDAERAVHYLHYAAEQALQRMAYTEAISHVTTALELLKTLPDTVERAQRELALQITLGEAVGSTKGRGAPETGRIYARARELGQQVGETPQLFVALAGLHEFYVQQGKYQTAQELAEQLLSVAQRQRDPALLVTGHWKMGQSLFWLGELSAAHSHLEQAIALDDPQRHPTAIGGRISADQFAASVLWLLGYPEQAMERNQEALTLARELARPAALATILSWAAWLHLYRREGPWAQERAEACITLATEHGFAARVALGTIMRGWALAAHGQGEEGIAHMRQGVAAWRAAGSEVGLTNYLSFLAEAYGHVGQTAEGLNVLAEALAFAHTTGERCWEAELYRLKGELLLQSGVQSLESGGLTPDAGLQTRDAEAEACLRQALEIAHRQQAKSLELRAAMSLGRLWQQQGKRAAAYELLAPIYDWFTEGFDTADLQEAKALLEALRA